MPIVTERCDKDHRPAGVDLGLIEIEFQFHNEHANPFCHNPAQILFASSASPAGGLL
jgi:hypothetical protein